MQLDLDIEIKNAVCILDASLDLCDHILDIKYRELRALIDLGCDQTLLFDLVMRLEADLLVKVSIYILSCLQQLDQLLRVCLRCHWYTVKLIDQRRLHTRIWLSAVHLFDHYIYAFNGHLIVCAQDVGQSHVFGCDVNAHSVIGEQLRRRADQSIEPACLSAVLVAIYLSAKDHGHILARRELVAVPFKGRIYDHDLRRHIVYVRYTGHCAVQRSDCSIASCVSKDRHTSAEIQAHFEICLVDRVRQSLKAYDLIHAAEQIVKLDLILIIYCHNAGIAQHSRRIVFIDPPLTW